MNTTEVAMLARLRALGLAGTPAEKIVKRPGSPLWQHAGTAAQLVEQLCRNVYWYGRNGVPAWVWDAGSGGNPTGEALARGNVTQTNCGGFNLAARWIGHNVLGLPDTDLTGAYTGANDCFITLSGTQAIDRNWAGNVRTLAQDFAQVGAYFFKGHSFCSHLGTKYDASTNVMNFNVQTDLYWCALAATNAVTAGADGRTFIVTQRHQLTAIPGPLPYACVSTKALKNFRQLFPIVWMGGGVAGVTQSFIRALPDTTGHGWATMLLVSRDHLPVAFRQTFHL